MKYFCETKDGKSSAVIATDEGEILDSKECGSKFEAMELRDAARNAGVVRFDHIGKPMYEVLEAFTAPAPAPTAEDGAGQEAKPKRVRKKKAA